MKKILYIKGVLLAFASYTKESLTTQEQDTIEQTFNLVSQPKSGEANGKKQTQHGNVLCQSDDQQQDGQ